MRFALIGTRGVPAQYGGFETAVEEIGQRMVAYGHEVVVYCRGHEAPRPDTYLGMELVHLPAARRRSLETLSHTALSALHLSVTRRRPHAAVVFNSANAPFVPVLRAQRIPTAVHVDGLEWRRDKWSGAGQRYYRNAESLSVRWADALIADAQGIADYYTEEFGARTRLLTYGAPVLEEPRFSRIGELGLRPKEFHVAVARLEPENHVAEIVAGYRESKAQLPLVVVGSAPYAHEYTARVTGLAAGDDRIRLIGAVWDQQQLDELYAGSLTYLHGHSVGGTNPSLLRAMGAAAGVLAYDVVFNREVLGEDGRFFATPEELGRLLADAEDDPGATVEQGRRLRERAASRYRWDDVARGYEELLLDLAHRRAPELANRGRGRRLSRG